MANTRMSSGVWSNPSPTSMPVDPLPAANHPVLKFERRHPLKFSDVIRHQ